MLTRKASFLGSISLFLAGLAFGGQAVANWSAPATWSPAKARGALTTMGNVTGPLPFVGLAPCRIVDTRGNGAPITGGMFTASELRNYAVAGICGIPGSAQALSLNITVTGPGQTGPGFLLTWPTGGTPPPVSSLNWDHVPATVGNAAVVPTNTSTSFTVNVSGPTHVIIDINGYYPGTSRTYPLANGQQFAIYGFTLGGVIYGENSFAYGVQGEASAATGALYGVYGHCTSSSADAGGVYGLDGTGVFRPINPYDSAGVRGESGTHNGVLGFSRFTGVAGSVINTSGTELAYGLLGFNNGTVYGVFAGGSIGATGTKFFVEPHPTDASKVIRYVSLEGPEAGTYFRGRGKFQNGLATIDVPEDFRMVTDSEGLSIQVTPIGELATVAVVRIDLEGILVKASRNVEFFYTVNGVRKTHRDLKPIGPGAEFMPRSADAQMPAYLTEGQKAMLVSNGTYNADGTVNMETAERLGWAKAWRDREEPGKAAATAN
jgi:hypothetical protein